MVEMLDGSRQPFRIGDVVEVIGYDGLFVVESYTYSTTYSEGGAVTELVYNLERLTGKQDTWIIAFPEDMRYVSRIENIVVLDDDKNIYDSGNDEIDILLDEYNDYMALYKQFGDTEYLAKAHQCIGALKALTARAGR